MAKLFEKVLSISPWHFVWIAVLSSEIITYALSTLLGRIGWGSVSRETLVIGAIDALVAPLIIAPLAIFFVRRITALQLSNERLAEANRKLQDLDRLKSEFLSVVSHEFRTPLTTIKAFIELVIMKPDLSDQRKAKLLATINSESDRLTRLTSDLLDLARFEAGSVRWRIEPLSLADVIQESLASMGQLSENKGLIVTTDLAPGLPQLRGDRDRIVQVITNLLSNAVKFTPRGGAVHVAARNDPSGIIVEIRDTGTGIPEEELDRIFDKFHRASVIGADAIEGTGLGLSIARQIVEHHGGRIWAQNNPGAGSTFSFLLPPAPPERERSVASELLPD